MEDNYKTQNEVNVKVNIMGLTGSFRRVSIIGGLICSVLMIVMIANGLLFGDKNEKEPDIDLDNFVISELTETQIVKISNRSSSYLTGSSYSGEQTRVSKQEYSDADYDMISFNAKKTTGIITLSASRVVDSKLSIIIDCKKCIGDAKLFIIMDDQIIDTIDDIASFDKTYDATGEHNFYVKLAAKDAEVDITVSRNIE